MFECTTDQFLIHLATASERHCDPQAILEDALDGLGPRRPMTEQQEAIIKEHLGRGSKQSRAVQAPTRNRIPEAA